MEKIKVAVKKGSKWMVSNTDFEKIRKGKMFGKLGDIKELYNVVTLKKYLKDNKIELTPGYILEKLQIKSLYVILESVPKTKKETVKETVIKESPAEEVEKDWWKNINAKCINCEKDCKQSSKVKVVKC